MILSTAYCPPVSWFAAAAKEFTLSTDRVYASKVKLEACENYQKQSYRNRCKIMTANGVEALNYPIVHDGSHLITDIKVDYSTPWVVRTERAISSAYESSAYFDYYKDNFFEIIETRHETLWELNIAIISYLTKCFGLAVDYLPTTEYIEVQEFDYRTIIHPKRDNSILEDMELEKPYFQVFTSKYGFVKDLSAIDLLFNEGPNSILFLKNL